MYLSISEDCRQSFLIAAARVVDTAVAITVKNNWLHIQGMAIEKLATALAVGAFPCWEKQRLRSLTARYLSFFSAEEQRQIVKLAAANVAEDSTRGGIIDSIEELQDKLCYHLKQGVLNFDGFCRFCLPGFDSYLRYQLEIAADQLLAEEEQLEYLQLLRQSTHSRLLAKSNGKDRKLLLIFSPGSVCQLWQQEAGTWRLLEGGCFAQREDMLLANVITAAPQKLVISGTGEAPKTIRETLAAVFGERLEYDDSLAERIKMTATPAQNSLTSSLSNDTIIQ